MSFAALLAELFYIKTTWLKCVAHMLRKQVDRLKQKGVSPNNHAKKERRINSDRFRWKRINKYTSEEIVYLLCDRGVIWFIRFLCRSAECPPALATAPTLVVVTWIFDFLHKRRLIENLDVLGKVTLWNNAYAAAWYIEHIWTLDPYYNFTKAIGVKSNFTSFYNYLLNMIRLQN